MTEYGIRFNAAVAAELRAERARSGVSLNQLINSKGNVDFHVDEVAAIALALKIKPADLLPSIFFEVPEEKDAA